MKSILARCSAALSFTVVIFMHAYFILLVASKPALAQNTQLSNTPPAATKTVETRDVRKDKDTEEVPKAFHLKWSMDEGLKINEMKDDSSSADGKTSTNEFLKEISKTLASNSKNKNEEPPAVAILVPGFFFLCLFACLFTLSYFRSRTRREMLQTIRALAEKGQPIPSELLQEVTKGKGRAFVPGESPWVQGLKPIFWGVGILVFFVLDRFNAGSWMFGFAPVLVGAYYVMRSHLSQKNKSNTDAYSTSTPS